MLARSALRTLSKRALQSSPTPTTVARVSLKTSAKACGPSVSVISYQSGERKKQEINVENKADGSITPLSSNLQKAAKPFDSSLHSRFTPTLQKFTLLDKVALVTGGGRGLGYNMAQAMAEVGVRGIAIVDVQQEIGDKAVSELSEQTGVDVRFYCVDVRDRNAVHQTVQDVVDHFGGIDVVVNAAGIADSNIKAEAYDVEKFRRLVDINVTGTFITTQACAQQMIRAQKGGSIINIASMSATIVNYPQEQSCYNASKAAVIQLTKSLAAEWAPYNIRVNSISPGYMDTALNRAPALDGQKKIWMERTPQGRLGAVDELNNLAVYLASEGSSFMTGNNCIIDGGYTLW